MNPSRVAGAIGVGVGAELIMVTSDEPNRFHVHAYGDNTALTEALGEESKDVEMTPTTDESFEAGVAEIGKTLSQASRLWSPRRPLATNTSCSTSLRFASRS